MTLFRIIVILAAGLVMMLFVVILRAETTRLHYEISQRERQAGEYRQQLREAQLELARLRNPMLIRKKVEQAVRQLIEKEARPDAAHRRERP